MQTTPEVLEFFFFKCFNHFNSVGLLTFLLRSSPQGYSFLHPGTKMLHTSPLHPQDALSERVQGETSESFAFSTNLFTSQQHS